MKASAAAILKGIVIVGVGAQVGGSGRANILALTSNQCPAGNSGCGSGLTLDKPGGQCVTPCDDHYIDASTFAALDGIVDNVVELTCVEPGCQFTWGGWSPCAPKASSFTCAAVGGSAVANCETRTQAPVISFNPNLSAGEVGACPLPQTAECGSNECNAPADFLLLLDASGSMGSDDWQSQISFAKDFVTLLPSGAVSSDKFDFAQVAILQFSSATATVSQSLTDSRTNTVSLLNPATYIQDSGGKSSYFFLCFTLPVHFFFYIRCCKLYFFFLTFFLFLFFGQAPTPWMPSFNPLLSSLTHQMHVLVRKKLLFF